MPIHPLLVVVLLLRMGELVLAGINTRRLRAQGAWEAGAGHYPLMVAMHALWWLTLAFTVSPATPPRPWPLAGVALLLAGRVWVIATLGRYWTTRIITLPSAPLVRRGPYRWLDHPNYWIVAGEVALVPLAIDALAAAVAFSALNGAMLAWRIAVEERALTPRRPLPATPAGSAPRP